MFSFVLFENCYHPIYFPKRRSEQTKCHFFSILCRYEMWSLTLGKEPKLRVFENKALRKIFESEKDEVSGQLHYKETWII